jgi:hypothetical protein
MGPGYGYGAMDPAAFAQMQGAGGGLAHGAPEQQQGTRRARPKSRARDDSPPEDDSGGDSDSDSSGGGGKTRKKRERSKSGAGGGGGADVSDKERKHLALQEKNRRAQRRCAAAPGQPGRAGGSGSLLHLQSASSRLLLLPRPSTLCSGCCSAGPCPTGRVAAAGPQAHERLLPPHTLTVPSCPPPARFFSPAPTTRHSSSPPPPLALGPPQVPRAPEGQAAGPAQADRRADAQGVQPADGELEPAQPHLHPGEGAGHAQRADPGHAGEQGGALRAGPLRACAAAAGAAGAAGCCLLVGAAAPGSTEPRPQPRPQQLLGLRCLSRTRSPAPQPCPASLLHPSPACWLLHTHTHPFCRRRWSPARRCPTWTPAP